MVCEIKMKKLFCLFTLVFFMLMVAGCSKTYYSAMEKFGKHKRDIMVDRVENARDSQAVAQEQFKSALEQFDALIKLKETDLKRAYTKLNREYEESEDAAEDVSDRIDKVESVAEALFEEWEEELGQYQSKKLRRTSRRQLRATRANYKKMLISMHKAEASMRPVLRLFKDNVLFLKHNLNAQAVGSLKSEFKNLKGEISVLLRKMSAAIKSSNRFIAEMK